MLYAMPESDFKRGRNANEIKKCNLPQFTKTNIPEDPTGGIDPFKCPDIANSLTNLLFCQI